MRNFEYYEDKIKEFINSGNDFCINKKDEMVLCENCICNNCRFYGADESCVSRLIKWFYEEYRPKINKRTKLFVDALETGYIARDEDGGIYWFIKCPRKLNEIWDVDGVDENVIILEYNFLSLDFIKWSDKEPWKVEDIRTLEVEDK